MCAIVFIVYSNKNIYIVLLEFFFLNPLVVFRCHDLEAKQLVLTI